MSQSGMTQSMVISPVTGITGVWEFRRESGGYHRARSLPGHLLHLVISGSYRLRANAREYDVRPGDVIYYHETEEVEWLGNAEPVRFTSVGFFAPALPPLVPERRIFPSTVPIRRAFEDLYHASLSGRGIRRDLRIHSALLRIIVEIDWWSRPRPGNEASGAALWWRIERIIRERRRFRCSLGAMAGDVRCSRATVVRACRSATGMSPMRRLRDIRMEEARGLLRFSALSITQVADYLGYGRLHEFSREFSKYFGKSPSGARV